MCGIPIELVVEDGANRSMGELACGGGLRPRDTERTRQAENAEAGTESLFGMRPVLQDRNARNGPERCG